MCMSNITCHALHTRNVSNEWNLELEVCVGTGVENKAIHAYAHAHAHAHAYAIWVLVFLWVPHSSLATRTVLP